jgi:hypothetical protein
MIEDGGLDLIATGPRQSEKIARKIDEFNPTIETPSVSLVPLFDVRKPG